MSYDLIVVGAGSGGMGAAITAARQGLCVLWVEKERRLGGTGVNAYVNVWQPAYTTSPLAREVAKRLLASGEARYLVYRTDTPSGYPIYRIGEGARYEETIVSRYEPTDSAPLLVYTPQGMDALLRDLAAETGRVELWERSVFLRAHTEVRGSQNEITHIEVQTPQGRQTVSARWYIDATADIHLARDAGCAYTMGREGRDTYGEPSAPEEAVLKLNAWSLCFLVRQGPDRIVGSPGGGLGGDRAHIGEMPDGGFYVNMCLQILGEAGWAMGPEQARDYLLGNIFRRWPAVQRAYGLEGYGIFGVAPRIGVREGPRLVGRYVLNENDIMWGRFGRRHDDCIAFCDFGLDLHAPDKSWTETPNGPWGVPMRCLQPVEIDNLLVASRGASFSSLAASACRLQRTMIELGEAAGNYVSRGEIVVPERSAYTYRPAPD